MFPVKKQSAFAVAKGKQEPELAQKRKKRRNSRRSANTSMDTTDNSKTSMNGFGNKKAKDKQKNKESTSEQSDVRMKNVSSGKSKKYGNVNGSGSSQSAENRQMRPGISALNLDFATIPSFNFSSTPLVIDHSSQSSKRAAKGAGTSKHISDKIKRKKKKKTKGLCSDLKKNSPSPPGKRRKMEQVQFDNDQQEDDEDEKQEVNIQHVDCHEEARSFFNWLINPHKIDTFFREVWEKKYMYIERDNPFYFKHVFSTQVLDNLLKKENLLFNKNIDVTTYTNGVRETHNPDGRAYRGVVWDYYSNGCSVRMLNPQTYCKSVMRLCCMLQEFFGSFVGANVYLTPPGTQGFAPHYDDIEAFVLQLEGKKLWKIYKPLPGQELPRYSSNNFTAADLGIPIFEVEMKPGDVLYFPRGTIHEASTVEGTHSLHVTLSTYQKNSYADILEKVMPVALQNAIEEDVEFREGLPLRYYDFMGLCNSEKKSAERDQCIAKLKYLMMKLVQYAPIDLAADQQVKGFIYDALPPVLTPGEKACSIHGAGERWENGKIVDRVELDPDDRIRLLRPTILRIVTDAEDTSIVRVYHSSTNSREYHENLEQFFELDSELAPAIEFLIHVYPEFKAINDLPLQFQDTRMELASTLYDRGLVVTEKPLDIVED